MFTRTALAGVLLFFLTACEGGFDWVLPSKEIEVNAYINGYSLNERSIIRQKDIIRPYFVHSVANDPDVRGLIVFFQTLSGTVTGKKTWYTSRRAGGDAGPVETPSPPVPPVIVEPEKESEPSATVEPEKKPEPPVIVELEKKPEPPVIVEPEKKPEPPVIVESEKKPEPPVIVELEIPELLIPELKISKNAIENWSDYRIIQIERLDREFPTFTITEDLEIGPYFLVFQILGEKDMLYQIEKPIYFLGNAELTFDDIQCYLPGLPANTYSIPPGINILLDAQVIADKRLDPYIVWYDGKKSIGEGKISAGANRFMWKVPEQTGFHTIKAVIFPFRLSQNSGINGMVKELSVAVSSKSKNLGYFSKETNRFVHWYRFQSDLLDSKAPWNERRSLRPQKNRNPQWLTYTGGMYGLAVGTNDAYLLPDTTFIFSQEEQGAGNVSFHILPRSDGTIFNADFKTFDKTDFTFLNSLGMKLSLENKNLLLTVTLEDASYKESLPLFDSHKLITPSLTFNVSQSQITVQLSLEETGTATQKIVVDILGVLTGAGTFQLGEIGDTSEIIAIFDELGVAFTKTALPSKPDNEAQSEEDSPEPDEQSKDP